MHRLDEVVERQRQAAAQLDDQAFFPFVPFAQGGGQAVRADGLIDDLPARLPTRPGAAVMPSARASAALLAWLFSI